MGEQNTEVDSLSRLKAAKKVEKDIEFVCCMFNLKNAQRLIQAQRHKKCFPHRTHTCVWEMNGPGTGKPHFRS